MQPQELSQEEVNKSVHIDERNNINYTTCTAVIQAEVTYVYPLRNAKDIIIQFNTVSIVTCLFNPDVHKINSEIQSNEPEFKFT